MSLLTRSTATAPHITSIFPAAALPGGELELRGSGLEPEDYHQPTATIGETPSPVVMSHAARVLVRVPEGALSGNVGLHVAGRASNTLPVAIGVAAADNVHAVANPVADAEGNIYVTLSGSRGQETPVSVFQIDTQYQIRPFVTGIVNATGLALDRESNLYVSSRHEGIVYRVTPSGAKSVFTEGMGVATGLAFDAEGYLYVGDRSGTIFKIAPDRQIFVFATLEPSVAAYHLAFNPAGVLFVSGPTSSSNECIHAIDREGAITEYYRGLGRPQGMAFDVTGNLYIAASLEGRRGIVKITPQREASLFVSGSGIVGLAFLADGDAALATHTAVYDIALGVTGYGLR
ncbi:MAG TPA: IPT/TIG domain-containing protein [Acidobacteriaceae bacterium]|nr:IPT/TIG domain-containing protein [Acidobacteriaceae bacterium]